MRRAFQEIVVDLESDGGLRDFYIHPANRADWNVFLRYVGSKPDLVCFTIDGDSGGLPQSFEGKPGVITYENAQADVIETFEPRKHGPS